MEPIANALQRMTPAPAVQMDRCTCGRTKRATSSQCWTCESAEQDRSFRASEGKTLLENFDDTMRTVLDLAGMSPEHMDADLAKIPAPVRRMIPDEAFALMSAGKNPGQGFGLAGTPGTGKSMAAAALVVASMRIIVRERAPIAGNSLLVARPPIAWCDWPSLCAWMRENADRVSSRTDRLIEAPLLVIDDVGAERRVKATYEEEFSAEKLDLILHGRRLRKLHTLWTSNLGSDALKERYGARTFSRLAGGNPCKGWISGKDLRFGPGA